MFTKFLGTSNPSFTIGDNTIFTGTADPNLSGLTNPVNGDLYIRNHANDPQLWIYNQNEINWNLFNNIQTLTDYFSGYTDQTIASLTANTPINSWNSTYTQDPLQNMSNTGAYTVDQKGLYLVSASITVVSAISVAPALGLMVNGDSGNHLGYAQTTINNSNTLTFSSLLNLTSGSSIVLEWKNSFSLSRYFGTFSIVRQR